MSRAPDGHRAGATMAYDHRDRQATHGAFDASAENARAFARAKLADTAYAGAEAAAGDRFGDAVRKVKRELKKAIVDDIKL